VCKLRFLPEHGVYDEHALVFGAFACSGALAAVSGAIVPALVPSLLPVSQLASANAGLGMAKDAGMALGALGAGLALASVGAAAALSVDALTFVAAFFLFRGVTLPRAVEEPAKGEDASPLLSAEMGTSEAARAYWADAATAWARSAEAWERLSRGRSAFEHRLLDRALAHRSWCAEHPGYDSNERLEFLGDAVLGMAVTVHAYESYPSSSEGELTDVRKAVVNAVTLAEVAEELSLGSYLLLGKGEEASGGREKPSILADALEAVIGMVYVLSGMEAAQKLVLHLLGSRLAEAYAGGPGGQDQSPWPTHFGRISVGGALSRLALVAPIAVLIYRDGPLLWLLALILLAVATDYFDGKVARWTGTVSEWGKVLDPLADKLAAAVVVLALVLRPVEPTLPLYEKKVRRLFGCRDASLKSPLVLLVFVMLQTVAVPTASSQPTPTTWAVRSHPGSRCAEAPGNSSR
jgi:dsRNA-specific ribonuclease